jgi:uncharacterized HAD superfamily protein
MTDKILSIIQDNYNKFTGTNEAELHAAEEIQAHVLDFISSATGHEKEFILKAYERFLREIK